MVAANETSGISIWTELQTEVDGVKKPKHQCLTVLA